jgi:hypothetical protein
MPIGTKEICRVCEAKGIKISFFGRKAWSEHMIKEHGWKESRYGEAYGSGEMKVKEPEERIEI